MKKRMFLLTAALVFGLILIGGIHPATTYAEKLLVAIGQEPAEVDLNVAGSGSTQNVAENWGEYLIQKTPEGNLAPGLATSWQFSPDYKELVFTLRKGVKFHSGDDFTAKDVEFSFQRALEKSRFGKIRLRAVAKFEATDDYHFKITFKRPDSGFVPWRAQISIVSKTYIERVGHEAQIRMPVATGPYKLVKYVQGQYIDVERFEDYWGPKPSVKEARIFFVREDTTRVAKLKAGEVDIIQYVPWALAEDVAKTKGIKIITVDTGHPDRGVVFSTRNPKAPWHDRRVRLAMAHAIDRESIVKDLLHGIPHTYGFIGPDQPGYDPAAKPWAYDPGKAKQLLAEAGYPNGFDMKFYYPIEGRVPMTNEIVQAVTAQLQAVGIKAQLIGEEYNAFRKRRKSAQKPEAVWVGYSNAGLTGDPHPANFLYNRFSSKGAFSVYSNPDLDKLTRKASGTMDEAKRAEQIKQAVNILYREVPAIPIYNGVTLWAMKENIDFKPTLKHPFDVIYIKDITMK